MKLIQDYLTLVSPFKKKFYLVVGVVFLYEAAKRIPHYIFSRYLDDLNRYTTLSRDHFLILIAALFLSRVLASFFGKAWGYTANRLINPLQEHFLNKSLWHSLHLPAQIHQQKLTGTEISKIQEGCFSIVWQITGESLWNFWPSIWGIILSFGFIATVDVSYALLFFMPILPLFLVTWGANKKLYPIREKRRDLEETAWGRFAQALSNLSVVQAFCAEEREETTYKDLRRQIKEISVQEWDLDENCEVLLAVISEIAKLVIIAFSFMQFEQGLISLGSLVLLSTMTDLSYSTVYRLNWFIRRALAVGPKVERITELFNQPDGLAMVDGDLVLGEIQGRISLKNVRFAYDDNGRDALNGVSFTIKPGQMVGIVGKSGAGKSTIINLLLKLVQPKSGHIAIDDINLNQLSRSAYLTQVAHVPQTTDVLSCSVAENIAYGAIGNTVQEADLITAAQEAYAHEFICELTEGYNTKVGERGQLLSGGQKQRLAIARALARKPRILIFDEATSDLDAETESQIQEWLLKQKSKREMTIVVVAHRLATIRKADKIIVLDQGKVVEEGNFDELIKRRGIFYRLAQIQGMV